MIGNRFQLNIENGVVFLFESFGLLLNASIELRPQTGDDEFENL